MILLTFSGGSWSDSQEIKVTLGGVTETITIASDSYAIRMQVWQLRLKQN